MQTVLTEIKKTVDLLKNDNEPEELHMRACMGLTVELMKDLRNTIVESGQYSKLVTSHTSKILAKCKSAKEMPHILVKRILLSTGRTQLGFLYRNVPCRAEGGKVTSEVQHCFLKVMNHVIVQFDNIMKESINKQDSGDPQNEKAGEFKQLHHNLKLFKKLTETASKNQAPLRSCKAEHGSENILLNSKLELQKIKEQNEQLKFNVFQRERSKDMAILSPKPSNLMRQLCSKMNNNHHSRRKSKGRQIKHRAHLKKNKSQSSEIQKNLRTQTSSSSFEFMTKELSELESNVPLVGSYQNIEGQDLKVLWVQKGQSLNRAECTSSNFVLKDLKEREPTVKTEVSFQNNESQKNLSMENQQYLQVLWDQKDKSLFQVSSNSYLFLPHLEKDKSQTSWSTESLKDLQVLWDQKDKPMVPSDLTINDLTELESTVALVGSFQNIEGQRSFQKDNSMAQTSSTASYPQFKDLSQNDESKTNLGIESNKIEQPMIQTVSTSSDFFLNILPKPGKDESQISLTTESLQDSQVLCFQKDKPMVQSDSTPFDFVYENLTEPESDVTLVGSFQNIERQRSLRLESGQDQQVLCFQNDNSMPQSSFTSSHPGFQDPPQNNGSETNLRIEPITQGISASSNFIFKDLSQPEKDEITKSLTTESPKDLQVLWEQKDKHIVETDSTLSDFIIKNITEPEPDENQESLGIESEQDLQALNNQKDNSKLQTSSTCSDFVVENLPQPKKDKSQPSLRIESLKDVPVLRKEIVKPTSWMSSTSRDVILKSMKELESNMALVGSPQSMQSSSLRRLPVLGFQKDQPHLHALWTRSNKPMVHTSSCSSDFLVKVRNLEIKSQQIGKSKTQTLIPSKVAPPNPISAEIPPAKTSQLPVTSQKSNNENKQPKTTNSYFLVGKTFGNHRLRLLRWCQERTKDYGVPMYEFSESWRSGRALVALIYSYRKDLIEERFNPERPTKESARNTLICGANAAKSLGVTSAVDIVQVCLQKVPDFYKVFTYVNELHSCLESKRVY